MREDSKHVPNFQHFTNTSRETSNEFDYSIEYYAAKAMRLVKKSNVSKMCNILFLCSAKNNRNRLLETGSDVRYITMSIFSTVFAVFPETTVKLQ